MRRLLLLMIVIMQCYKISLAQDSKSFYNTPYEERNSGAFDKSATLLSFGVGFPNKAVNHNDISGFPPLYAKYEHGFLRDEIGMGAYLSSGWGSMNYPKSTTHFSGFSIGSSVYYHFNKLIPIKEMDVFIGAGLGYKHISYRVDDPNNDMDTSDDFIIGIIKIGMRYYIKPNFSFYAEGGYDGMTGINLGITFKLR